jgi:hypothetical protein
MDEQLIEIIYPRDMLNTPVINKLIQRYPELGVNIITEGMIELQLIGHSTMIESSIAWLKELGMELRVLG